MALHVGDEQTLVLENRDLLTPITGPIQFMNQSHGQRYVHVQALESIEPDCDALITTTPGIAVAVLTADCIPLLLISSQVVAAVHVGRKGLINNITVKVIDEMKRLGATSIHAKLGPSICGLCYEVPAVMAQEVALSHPQALALTRTGTPSLDLPKALIAVLLSQGLTFEASEICTLENSDYFSYRREKITGRNAAVVWL
ncbi:unannotated protein [freshwater metagenome]|uniref:Unannotated protein n=2 Tax=freshwater metagenome TaxID=449393 RepID=A0A6J7W0Q6_9ZZZZ